MKRKLIILGMLGFTVLFGCNQSNEGNVSASNNGEMNVVSVDEVYRGEAVILKHKSTGCYYTYVRGSGSTTSNAPTQMMIEKNGVTVPYCEE